MKIIVRRVRRIAVLVAGTAGLLALPAGAAHAFVVGNHCEPQPRRVATPVGEAS